MCKWIEDSYNGILSACLGICRRVRKIEPGSKPASLIGLVKLRRYGWQDLRKETILVRSVMRLPALTHE